jgi:hypothetical protein
MRWRRLVRRVEAFRDGALSPKQASRVRDRLERDSDAADVLRRTEALGRVIHETWTDAPPAPDTESLLARLRPGLGRVDRQLEERSFPTRLGERLWAGVPSLRPMAVPAGIAAAVVGLLLLLPPLFPNIGGPGIAQASTEVRSLRSPQSVTVFVLEGGEGCAIIWVVEREAADPDLSSNDPWWGGWS